MRKEKIVQSIFLDTWLLRDSAKIIFLFFIELGHSDYFSFATWLLFDLCLVEFNLVIHSSQTLHGRSSTTSGVVTLPLSISCVLTVRASRSRTLVAYCVL